MKKVTYTLLFMVFVPLVFYVWITHKNRQKIEWVGGQKALSPNKKWLVYFKTTSTTDLDASYSQLMVFDTEMMIKLD